MKSRHFIRYESESYVLTELDGCDKILFSSTSLEISLVYFSSLNSIGS